MTSLHEPIAVPREHLDVLDRLNERDRRIADQLIEEYHKAVRFSKGIGRFLGRRFRGDFRIAILTDGEERFPRQLASKYNCHESTLVLDRSDDNPLLHFDNIVGLVNDHLDRISRGRPFRVEAACPPDQDCRVNLPFLIVAIHINGDE